MTATATAKTKTPIKDAALDAAWEAHQSQERRAFEERFAADQKAQAEAQAAEAAAAAERDKAVAARHAAETKLSAAMAATEGSLTALVETVVATLTSANEHYNSGIILGLSNGVSSAVRDRISARINHRLRVEANMPAFEQSIFGRSPLDEAAASYQSNMSERNPLPPRRDTHEPEPSYPGQNVESRPIIKTELQKDDGEWVTVQPGQWDWDVEPGQVGGPRP